MGAVQLYSCHVPHANQPILRPHRGALERGHACVSRFHGFEAWSKSRAQPLRGRSNVPSACIAIAIESGAVRAQKHARVRHVDRRRGSRQSRSEALRHVGRVACEILGEGRSIPLRHWSLGRLRRRSHSGGFRRRLSVPGSTRPLFHSNGSLHSAGM